MRTYDGWVRAILAACSLIVSASALAGECERAAESAERRFGLPGGLLQAIGLIETGRTDQVSGARTAWPWSVHEADTGQLLRSADDAIDWVERRRAAGARSIDVGCFQVNLMYHADAFTNLVEAFDPNANAVAAARFLTSLHDRLGTWEAAVAAYHSSSPDRGPPYRERVYAAWRQPLPLAEQPKPAAAQPRLPAGLLPRILGLAGGPAASVSVEVQSGVRILRIYHGEGLAAGVRSADARR